MGTAVLLDITRAPTADGLAQASVPFIPRSCVEAFLRPRHTRYLDSVPQGPEHAPILRGTKPAHQELKEIPRSLLMSTTHSSSTVTTATRRSALGVGARRGRRPPSWPVEGAPKATEGRSQ